MKITHVRMDREDAVTALGPHWPPRPGAIVGRCLALADVDHGTLSVHGDDGQPGTAWLVVDGLIVPQDAGPAPLLPGCSQYVLPEPALATPPITP